ncbi:hypothetical protein RJ639_017596 [Escallonia herrerae]|uniref:HMA domain-containing protein n=1 Tax=Escallonia herrerae TaxID=1293975 RepID=A0AA89AKM2_9ASTE|nr:hypothetical protein RJ639_017596 [Escallonia herrerae]
MLWSSTGISSVAVDSDEGTLTVLGDADPVLMVKHIRKTGKLVEIISVGPVNPKLPKPHESNRHLFTCCKDCQLVAIYHKPYEGGLCSIL